MRGSDWLLLWTLSLLWGGSFLFNELALAGLPPLTVVWGRVGLAALILWGVVRLKGAALPPRALWPALLVMGLLNNAVPFTLFVLAQGQITGALASVLNAMTPLFTVLVAHFATSDEKLTPARGLGVALGFGGVLAMFADGGMAGTQLALLACLGAAFSYALASVWGRRFRAAGLPPLATAFGQLTASSVLLLPIWLVVDRPWTLDWPGWEPVLAVIALASLSSALAYLIFFRILAEAGATAVSLVTFLIPISAAGLGWLVLGERLEPRQLIGLALILAGLAVIDGRLSAAVDQGARGAQDRGMRPDAILETALYAPDLAAAKAFYGGVLGLPVIAEVSGRHVFFRVGAGVLLVFDPQATEVLSTNPVLPVPVHGARGPGHVCFAASRAEIALWRERLAAAGAAAEAEFDWPNGARSLYVRDPAGNSVEFAEPRLWD